MAGRIVLCDQHGSFGQAVAAALGPEADLDLIADTRTLDDLDDRLGRQATDLILLDLGTADSATASDSATAAIGKLADHNPVVVIAAADDPALVQHALQAGALGCIPRDAAPAEILRLIRRALDGMTAMDSDMALRLARSLRHDRQANHPTAAEPPSGAPSS